MSKSSVDADPSGTLALADALEKDAKPWGIVSGAAHHLREQRAEIERLRAEVARAYESSAEECDKDIVQIGEAFDRIRDCEVSSEQRKLSIRNQLHAARGYLSGCAQRIRAKAPRQ